MMNFGNETRLTDALERELMAQAIAEQQGYNVVADLKALFGKARSYFNGASAAPAQPVHQGAAHAA